MRQLCEGLSPNDLEDLIKPVFDVDTYKSMTGDDDHVVVISFEVIGNDPAKDLVNFIEQGYKFVVDSDVSSGETDEGVFRVFVELERGRKTVLEIEEILYGLTQLSAVKEWRFRYYKDRQSHPIDELKKMLPTTPETYRAKMDESFENDIRFFFRKSPMDYMMLENNLLTFKRIFNSPLKMEILDYGTRLSMLTNLEGTIRIDETSTSETMWLTKYFGNYNITKYDDFFVFENDNTVFKFKLIR
jgi:hypothetical protein